MRIVRIALALVALLALASPTSARAQAPDCTRDDDTLVLLFLHAAALAAYGTATLVQPVWQGEGNGVVPALSYVFAGIGVGAGINFLVAGCHASSEPLSSRARERVVGDESYARSSRTPTLVIATFLYLVLASASGFAGAVVGHEYSPIASITVALGLVGGLVGLMAHHANRIFYLRAAQMPPDLALARF